MPNFTPTICIDFDGVIHSYDRGWQGGVIYGEVTAGFWDWAIRTHAAGVDLVVYSSRSSEPDQRLLLQEWLIQQWVRSAPERWVARNVSGGEPEFKFNLLADGTTAFRLAFASEKPAAWITIDDRAIQFTGDWADPALSAEAIMAFKPWNAKA